MRGLWHLTINSGRGAILKKIHRTAVKARKEITTLLNRKEVISASIILRKAWLGSELGDSGSRNPFM